MGSLYLWGRSIQEMGGDVVIGLLYIGLLCGNRWVVMLSILRYSIN